MRPRHRHNHETLLVRSPERDTENFREAVRLLKNGGLVVFPTETVYGLGANALNAKAARSVFRAKGRPSDNPLIVHLASAREIGRVAASVPPAARLLLKKFAPGPITVILKKRKNIPDAVTAGLDTVAVRVPSHPVATRFLKACGVPVAAPSANRSGRPSPTTFRMACHEMTGRADAILSGGESRIGLESTVVRVRGKTVEILRPGAVTDAMIRKALEKKSGYRVLHAGSGKERGAAVSPGTRHAHYRPDARVILFTTSGAAGKFLRRTGLRAAVLTTDPGLKVPRRAIRVLFRSAGDYGRRLFRTFHMLDRKKVDVILAQKIPDTGIGKAVRNRLEKAGAGSRALD